MFVIAMTVLAACSAALDILGELRGPKRLVYIFKPLTMAFVIAIAARSYAARPSTYGALILVGLLFSIAGDVFLMLPADRFTHGLVSFLVAHVFYIAAFAAPEPGAPALVRLVPFLVFAALMMRLLWPGLGAMKLPVVVYMTAILAMGWFACERWFATGSDSSFLAAAGALLFMASDSLLALNRFRAPLRAAPLHVHATYFSGQWLIALSV